MHIPNSVILTARFDVSDIRKAGPCGPAFLTMLVVSNIKKVLALEKSLWVLIKFCSQTGLN